MHQVLEKYKLQKKMQKMLLFTSEVASLILVPWKLNQDSSAGGWEPCEWQWKV